MGYTLQDMYNSANPKNPRVIKNCLNNDDISNSINYYQSIIYQQMYNWIVLETILNVTLKFTLKQLQHVSV